MTEISSTKNIYLYGRDYNYEDTENWDIIVYAQPKNTESITLNNLEGFFVSEIPLIKRGDKGVSKEWQLVIRRDNMGLVEEKYQGKFFPFDKR